MPEVYDIYHDESQEESYWHGFLFIPRSSRTYLLKLLMEARKNINWEKAVSFKAITTRRGARSPRTQLVGTWISIGFAALQQQKFNVLPTPYFLGGTPPRYGSRLEKPIRAKFVVFKEKDKHEKMFSGLDELACIETTFRMGIKGGVHRLFSEKEPIVIGDVYIDGDQHYICRFGRRFDVSRSLRRFAVERRPYVSFTRGAKMIPQRSNHEKIHSLQNVEDSHFLQLCDLLLGGTRFHSFCPDSRTVKHGISIPCSELLSRGNANYYRIRQSRFFNGFALGEAWLESDEWQFAPLKVGEDKALLNVKQLELPIYGQKT